MNIHVFDLLLVPSKQISCIYLILYIVQTCVVAVGDDGLRLLFEFLEVVHHPASEEHVAIVEGWLTFGPHLAAPQHRIKASFHLCVVLRILRTRSKESRDQLKQIRFAQMVINDNLSSFKLISAEDVSSIYLFYYIIQARVISICYDSI